MVRKRLSFLVIIVMLIAQYTYGIGVPFQVNAEGTSVTSAVYDPSATVTSDVYAPKAIDSDIMTSVTLTVYGADGQVDPGPVYEQGSNVALDYTWTLPNGHDYHAGDTFTFRLPDQFLLYNDIQGSLESDEGSVGTFKVSQDTHQVVMTFNSFIQDHGNVHGTLHINTKFDKEIIKGNVEQQILFPINGDILTISVLFRPIGSTIDKKGYSEGFNSKNINWTVDVNKRLNTVESAVVTDPIPTGLSLVDPGVNVQVYKLNVTLNGSATRGDLIDPSNYSTDVTAGVLKVSFNSTIKTAYQIAYTTSITDDTKSSFTNQATFSGKDYAPVDATATVSVSHGGAFDKYVIDYQWSDQMVTWGIDYNFNQKEIPQKNAFFVDLFNNTQELVDSSLKVYPVAFDSLGVPTKGPALSTSEYTISPVTATGKSGFKLQFTNNVTNAYHIEYQTKSIGRVTSDTTITNTVTNNTYSDTAKQLLRTAVIYKNLGSVDYSKRTADWKITVNGDNNIMGHMMVTDVFPYEGMTFIKDSLDIRDGNDAKVDPSQYELTYDPNISSGFSIEFNSYVTGKYTISYTVKFNIDALTGGMDKFHNTATVIWRDVEDPHSVKHSAEAKGLFDPRAEVKKNGYKNGTYNPVTKEITWRVGFNYNGKALDNAIVKDLIVAPQALKEGSVKVYDMLIPANGSPSVGKEIKSDTYQVITNKVSNGAQQDTQLEVRLGSRNTPYYVIFKTSLEGQLLSEKVDNKANVYDGDVPASKDLTASVKIPSGGEYLNKSGVQNGDKIQWTVPINNSQSYIENAVLKDMPSTNQKLLLDSFHLYSAPVDGFGVPVKSTTELVRGTNYSLDFETDSVGKQTFTLKFKDPIKTPYVLVYQSLIAANNGDAVSNTAKLTGENVILVDKEVTKVIIVGISSGSGTGSGERSTLTVKKVDADNNSLLLSGAKFNLYRIADTERLLIDSQITQTNGTVVFNSILPGKYVLIEEVAPSGYVLDPRDQVITISSGSNLVWTVKNKKVSTPSPTPSVTPSATTSPTPSPTPSVTPSATTSPTPSPTPSVTPSATASPTPSPTPSANTSPTPLVTPSATASPTASPTPGTVTPPPGGVQPTPTEIVIVESAVPLGPGIQPSTSPTSSPSPVPIVTSVPDDNVPVGGIDIDEDEIPKGTVTDNSSKNPDVNKLPKTGEESPLPLYLMGMGLILAGYILNRIFKQGKKSE